MMVKIKSWLRLIKFIKTARVVRGVAAVHGSNITTVAYRAHSARQQHHNRYIYSHHQQLLLFLSILSILINF